MCTYDLNTIIEHVKVEKACSWQQEHRIVAEVGTYSDWSWYVYWLKLVRIVAEVGDFDEMLFAIYVRGESEFCGSYWLAA